MFIVLTGKPNSGKTSILNLLKHEGYEIFNTDEYVNEIYKVNNIGFILIKQKLGSEYVDNNKGVLKEKLKEFISKSKENYELLNSIIWPLIKDKLLSLKKEKKFLIVELSIYLIDRKYFSGIFDKIIVINRKEDLKNFSLQEKTLNRFFNNITYQQDDLIIENNEDILVCFNQIKPVINMLYQRLSSSLYRPLDDGYYLSKQDYNSVVLVWPSIYNFQFTREIKLIENTFLDIIRSISKICKVHVGVDMITYENLKSVIPGNTYLFGVHLFPFSINKNLLMFLENKISGDTRLLVSKTKNELIDLMFKKTYCKYEFPLKLNNSDFMIVENTMFIIKSKFDFLCSVHKCGFDEFLNYIKLFFSIDDLIIIYDDESSNNNNINKYFNVFNKVIFYSYDENFNKEIFELNQAILTLWSAENNYEVKPLKIVIFDDLNWLSYTNFIAIKNDIFIISLDEFNDVIFLKTMKQFKLKANIVIVDGSLYKTPYYYSINSIVKMLPYVKF